jgi:FkbM family methyltransferase
MINDTTVIIDAGARYGMHPTWQSYDANMRYLAFEPDSDEAERLARSSRQKGYEVHALALGETSGLRPLYITSHRGLCSFLKPDPDSFWFRDYRPDSGIIEREVPVETVSIDDFGAAHDIPGIDFLKVDTEGTELHVLKGAEHFLNVSVLGCHVSVSFQNAYLNQPLFSATHDYLQSKGFFLCNMDYHGYGMPQSPIFRKPDPLAPERLRYGILMHADGVWLLPIETIMNRFDHDPDSGMIAVLKYAAFCLNNHAPDVGLSALSKAAKQWTFSNEVVKTGLFRYCRRAYAALLGQWRVCEDALWHQIRGDFHQIFGVELLGGSEYWQQIREL